MKPATHIVGHLPPDSPLSERQALSSLPKFIHPLTLYDVRSLWERDTRQLPRVLGRARRRLRDFAERELLPRAAGIDLAPHRSPGETNPEIEAVMRAGGKAGILTNLLPRPYGSAPPTSSLYPLVWLQSIQTEELAAACGGLMLLLCAHALGVAPLVLSGDLRAVRRFLLPAFRQSEAGDPHLFAYAITEPGIGSDHIGTPLENGYKPGTVAKSAHGGWTLIGRKVFISGGDLARSISVFAPLENEGLESLTCFLVSPDIPGFSVRRTELKMGMRASGAAELEFDNVFVPDERVIGGLRRGWAAHCATMNASRIPVAGMAVGFARAAAEAAAEFACRVRLGNKELVHFQEVQLMLAQMIADTTAARSLVWGVARKSYAPRNDEAAMCKFYATDTAMRVCEMAMDLASNHGMLYGNRIEKIYRDARLTQIFEGTNQINRLAVITDQQEHLLAEITKQKQEAL